MGSNRVISESNSGNSNRSQIWAWGFDSVESGDTVIPCKSLTSGKAQQKQGRRQKMKSDHVED